VSAPQIAELIDKQDNSELVRDQIAAILLAETEQQQVLAPLAGKSAALWKLRIYTERSNPWDEFNDGDQTAVDTSPIVNISLDSVTFDPKSSNSVERQKAVGVYHVDVYGYAVSAASEYGHEPGDEAAAVEVQRAMRLVRNVLMAGHYVYLAMRGTVWRRWPERVQIFQPQMDGRPIQHVIAARLTLNVEFNETSPQVQGQPLDLITWQTKRASDGRVMFETHYDFT
jgi:hypothetical protein